MKFIFGVLMAILLLIAVAFASPEPRLSHRPVGGGFGRPGIPRPGTPPLINRPVLPKPPKYA